MIGYLKTYKKDSFEIVVLTTVSNINYRIPSGIIYLVAMFIQMYQINLVILSTIAITLVNSVINPVDFFSTHKKFQKEKNRVN